MSDNLLSTITHLRRELATTGKKAKFFKSQYEKYRKDTPDVAKLHKTMMGFEVRQGDILRGHIKKFEVLQKRRAEFQSKRRKSESA